jgi:hypothetical protein
MAKVVNVNVQVTVNDQDPAGNPNNSQHSITFAGTDAKATVEKAQAALSKIAADL